jgi:hypothetical protein
MKLYLIFQRSSNTIIRAYPRKKDFMKFVKLYADDDTYQVIVDTKHNPDIESEAEQTWGVTFEEDDGKVTTVRGVSFKPCTIYKDLLEKGTTTIFVTALTRQEALDKAIEIFNEHGKDENTI